MKSFKQFLKPAYPKEYEELLKTINADCKPWLDATRSISYPILYRGISDRQDIKNQINKVNVRTDRAPRDSKEYTHKELDYFLKKTFGFPYRSAGLFVTPQVSTANSYAWSKQFGEGRTCVVFPIGQFEYCFSMLRKDVSWWIETSWTPRWMEKNGRDINEYLQALRKMLFDNEKIEYVSNKFLKDAFILGHEIMLKCESYYTIPLEGYNLVDYDNIRADEFVKDVYDYV